MTLPQTISTASTTGASITRTRPLVARRGVQARAWRSVSRSWPPPQGQWTYDDWLRLPDDAWRYEIIKGVLYMVPGPSTAHQTVCLNLTLAISSFVRLCSAGRVFCAPTDVFLPGQQTPVQPDLLFIADARTDIIHERGIVGAPDLVVEIASPSTLWKDLRIKQPLYQEAGVREYWVVDTVAKTVHVFLLQDAAYRLTGQWGAGQTVASQVIKGFEIAVDAIFAV